MFPTLKFSGASESNGVSTYSTSVLDVPKEELPNIQQFSSIRVGEIHVTAGIETILDYHLAEAFK